MAVPDEKKGEHLVVLYNRDATSAETLQRHMAESALCNLWNPARDCDVEVESLPIIVSGKFDLKGLKEIALAAGGG